MKKTSREPSDINQQLACFNRAMREEMHLTVAEVAILTGVPPGIVRNAETQPLFLPAHQLTQLIDFYTPNQGAVPPVFHDLLGV